MKTFLKCKLCAEELPNTKNWRRDVKAHINQFHVTLRKNLSASVIKDHYFKKIKEETPALDRLSPDYQLEKIKRNKQRARKQMKTVSQFRQNKNQDRSALQIKNSKLRQRNAGIRF